MDKSKVPVAWLIPELQTFKDAQRVHFSRAPGCVLTDVELIKKFEGAVMWTVSFFHDDEYVVDNKGVVHRPKPLVEMSEEDYLSKGTEFGR